MARTGRTTPERAKAAARGFAVSYIPKYEDEDEAEPTAEEREAMQKGASSDSTTLRQQMIAAGILRPRTTKG